MIMDKLAKRGVCLIGCGFMGKALVEAWLAGDFSGVVQWTAVTLLTVEAETGGAVV